MIEAALLGPVVVHVDGQPAPPDTVWRKHLALAVVLWTERTRPIGRDRLLAMLWGDRPEQAARHSLNEALRVWRRACGDDTIDSTAEAVRWVAPIELDCDRFPLLAEDDPIAAAALVRGVWCEGLSIPGESGFEEWCSHQRTRWRGQCVTLLARAATLLGDRGDLLAARSIAERGWAIDSWSEHAALTLIRCLSLLGDRSGALAVAREHIGRLRDDLGAEPSPAVAELVKRLRSGIGEDQGSRPTTDHELVHRPPLLCRSTELERAMAVARGALQDGVGASVLALGAAGSGRSRLLAECSDRLQLEGVAIAFVHAVPGDGLDPIAGLGALADAVLTGLPGVGGGDPAAIATLASQRPIWAERFQPAPGPQDFTLVDALHSVLRAAADEGPVAVAIDDLDRFHPDAIANVAGLARSLSDSPVIFLLSATTIDYGDGMSGFARLIGRELPGMVLQIPSLDHQLVLALVEWGFPEWEGEAHQRLARRLLAESGDSVFIAVQLLEAVRSGLDFAEGRRWPSPERTFDTTIPGVPPLPLLMALRHTFHQLDPIEAKALQLLAAGPEPFPEKEMAGFWFEETTLLAVLDRLERYRWIRSDGRGYQIAARSVRRFLLEDTLTPGQRRRLESALNPA